MNECNNSADQRKNEVLAENPKWHIKCHIKSSKLDLNLRKKLVKCYIWSMALYGAETWTLRAVDQKQVESLEMWCWRMMEKISWTDHVRNEAVLLSFGVCDHTILRGYQKHL
jgi:hypothetical protein